jgi:hypothetical protein
MQSFGIGSGQLGASSVKDSTRAAAFGRIDVDYTSWTAGAGDPNPSLKIDLLQDYYIHALASQGAPDRNEWAKTLQFQFRADGSTTWTTSYVYLANSDQNTTVTYPLPSVVQARYIQVNLLSWFGAPSARMELYGRYLPNLSPIGLGAGSVAYQDNSIFSASSAHDQVSEHLSLTQQLIPIK